MKSKLMRTNKFWPKCKIIAKYSKRTYKIGRINTDQLTPEYVNCRMVFSNPTTKSKNFQISLKTNLMSSISLEIDTTTYKMSIGKWEIFSSFVNSSMYLFNNLESNNELFNRY